jgi:glycosyltransferase involved in cell wall biosynthesis
MPNNVFATSSKPLVSVIVPVYNVEKYLGRCVDSILGQTYDNLEVILVDDGSTDGCPAICDDYSLNDSRVKVIHKENGGLSDARNAGIEAMSGELVGFVDSDDYIERDMYEYLLSGMRNGAVGIACCPQIDTYEYRKYYNVSNVDETFDSVAALEDLFFDRRENYAWNKLYRAELWDGVRFPKGMNFEDIATVYKTYERARNVMYLREPKYYYIHRKSSISGTKDFNFKRDIYLAVIARYNDAAPRMPQFKPALFRRVRNWYVHELCRDFRGHPENDPLNLKLLEILAPFVAKNKDEIADILNFEPLERKKLDAFAKGTREGCLESLEYHDLMWKRRNAKGLYGKIVKHWQQ